VSVFEVSTDPSIRRARDTGSRPPTQSPRARLRLPAVAAHVGR